MIKADYSKIAAYYDKGRFLSEQNTIMWLGEIAVMSRAAEGATVLDLGCGTGRFSVPMSNLLKFNVIGIDSSVEMLGKAKQKDPEDNVNWMIADAAALSLPRSAFDLVFLSHLLHHIDYPLKVLQECHRILVPSGVILIRYGAMDQIRNDVVHTFFPGVNEIDESRTPTREHVGDWLHEAGFTDISSKEVAQQTYASGMEHLNAVKAKSTSVLSMISEASFRTGIIRFSEYVEKNPNDEWLLFDRMTMTMGHKKYTID